VELEQVDVAQNRTRDFLHLLCVELLVRLLWVIAEVVILVMIWMKRMLLR
jgi:hypothetical protein